jgi:hypothetical protein
MLDPKERFYKKIKECCLPCKNCGGVVNLRVSGTISSKTIVVCLECEKSTEHKYAERIIHTNTLINKAPWQRNALVLSKVMEVVTEWNEKNRK